MCHMQRCTIVLDIEYLLMYPPTHNAIVNKPPPCTCTPHSAIALAIAVLQHAVAANET